MVYRQVSGVPKGYFVKTTGSCLFLSLYRIPVKRSRKKNAPCRADPNTVHGRAILASDQRLTDSRATSQFLRVFRVHSRCLHALASNTFINFATIREHRTRDFNFVSS